MNSNLESGINQKLPITYPPTCYSTTTSHCHESWTGWQKMRNSSAGNNSQIIYYLWTIFEQPNLEITQLIHITLLSLIAFNWKHYVFTLIYQVMHARSGGTLEVMGLMLGKVDGDTMIVMDAFALPVEGTETRVNAQVAAYEYMAAYIESAKLVRKLGNVLLTAVLTRLY